MNMSLENLLLGLFSTRFCVSCHTFPSRNLQRSDLFLPILLTDDTKAGSKYASTIPLDGAHLVAVRGLIHQEVPECVSEESSTERRS